VLQIFRGGDKTPYLGGPKDPYRLALLNRGLDNALSGCVNRQMCVQYNTWSESRWTDLEDAATMNPGSPWQGRRCTSWKRRVKRHVRRGKRRTKCGERKFDTPKLGGGWRRNRKRATYN
jgi:hypothetical protein